MFWANMREEEFEKAIAQTDGLCVIPIGCFEMHGQHLPVATDCMVAEKIAEIRGISAEEAARITFENGKRLYRI